MWTFVFVCLSISVTGLHADFSVTVSPSVKVKENEGVDLKCSYTADFGSAPRVEWKFKDLKGSQILIYFDNKPTGQYAGRITMYDGGLRFNKVTRADTGDYDCEVSGNTGYGENTIKLTVLVPPSKPVSRIPSSVTTGNNVRLTCFDADGSPPSTYRWYKDNTPLPEDPTKFPSFKNLTYKMNVFNGNLEFPSVSKLDSGSYLCEASNGEGAPQRGDAVHMEVRDLNVGGIVAGVIVALLAVGLLLFGLWFASKKGYLPSKFSLRVCVCERARERERGRLETQNDLTYLLFSLIFHRKSRKVRVLFCYLWHIQPHI
uniref:Junctional adhesion molecule A n=1 Tax=Sinocyclocheilus anshuiensis TaxID=1608454 RepID=A0A671QVM8_9TELE